MFINIICGDAVISNICCDLIVYGTTFSHCRTTAPYNHFFEQVT